MRRAPWILFIAILCAIAFAPTPRLDIQTRLDPILAFPGTDIAALHRSIEDLARTADIIASYYPEPEARTLSATLVPRDSLHALASLEDARRDFLDAPYLYLGVRYLLRTERAITALEHDTHRLADALRSQERPITFVFAEGYATTDSLAKALDAFVVSLDEYRSENRRRIGCIAYLCELVFPPPPDRPAPLSREVTDTKRTIMHAYATIHGALDAHVEDMPKLLRMRSVCAAEPESLILASTHTSYTGAAARRIMSLSDITMYDYTPESLAARSESGITHDPGITRFFADHGVTYTYQPEGNFYFCLEAGRDALAAGRLLGFAAALEAMRSANALPAIPRNLIDSFLDAPYLDEHASSLVIAALDERARDGTATDAELELLTLARAGTYHYEDVLESAVQMHEFQIGLLDATRETPPAIGALVMRSFPSVVFPLYASPDAPSLISSPNDAARSSGDSTSYLTLLETVPREELDAAVVRYAGFMNENRERVKDIAEQSP